MDDFWDSINRELDCSIEDFNKVIGAKPSKSKNNRLLHDHMFLTNLLDIMMYDSSKVHDLDFTKFNSSVYLFTFGRDMRGLGEACAPAIQAYKNAQFFDYNRDCYKRLSRKFAQEIVLEFLKEFVPDGVEFYNKIFDDGKFIINSACLYEENALGLSFPIQTINKYFLILSDDVNSLEMCEALIHEFIHLYCARFLSVYNSKANDFLYYSYFVESATLFAELKFFDYVLEHQLDEDFVFHRNNIDFKLLQYYKELVYAEYMRARGNTFKYNNNSFYEVIGKNTDCKIDRNIAFFEYNKKDKRNAIVDASALPYALSSLEAYRMLERERNGEKSDQIIKDFLIGLQYADSFRDLIGTDYNYKFLEEEISSHMKVLAKRSPIDGYRVEKYK